MITIVPINKINYCDRSQILIYMLPGLGFFSVKTEAHQHKAVVNLRINNAVFEDPPELTESTMHPSLDSGD
ncbi:unnamed protein product [Sphenostylis stenocarpa]|uniref:Uncharacterized protein n=1 Tax=Sphenostylis stenocarpa TaxID=92480 RepID=A0AA86SV64_9FABA|nr:unnamed protein product [Sphenostylis stenocarpa]